MSCFVKRVMLILVVLNVDTVVGGERQKNSELFKGVKYQPARSESFSSVSQSSSHDTQESTVELPALVKDTARQSSEKKDFVTDGLLPHWQALQEPMLEGRHVTPAEFLAAGIEKELQPLLYKHDNEIAALDRQYERDITCAKRGRWAGRCAALLSLSGVFAGGNFGVTHAINAFYKNKCG